MRLNLPAAPLLARCVRLARAVDLREQRTLLGMSLQPVPLTEEQATKRGGELLAEALVVGLGLGVVLHQTHQSAQEAAAEQKKQRKAEAEAQQAFRASVTATEARLMARLDAIERRLGADGQLQQQGGQQEGRRESALAKSKLGRLFAGQPGAAADR